MIEFFTYSWKVRIFITFILGISVLTQTLAIVFNFYRSRLTKFGVIESLLEVAVLSEILVFSLLYGQIINVYKQGFAVVTGFDGIRVLVFIMLLILVILVAIIKKSIMPLSILAAAIISLQITESILGHAFPWLFMGTLFFFIGRSIIICISSFNAIRTNISALSVINAVDTLHTGVLFSENDGYTLLSNHQMQSLMLAITGKIFRNAMQFYNILLSDEYESRYKKAELDGQIVYLLPDGTAWMFTKTDIILRMKNYIHISAADVSEHWALTAKIQLQDLELRHKSDILKKTIANLHILCKERELENARMRAHDILGQRLSVLLRIIQNENNLDYNLLSSLSKGLLEELKAEQSETGAQEELDSIQQIFATIGVDIRFEGQLPEDSRKACLFADIIREGSTNAVRHGFATQINIKAEPKENAYNLTISNNGHTTPTPITLGSGIGVLRKKIKAQGGKLDIIQHPIFTLSVFLPGGDQYE